MFIIESVRFVIWFLSFPTRALTLLTASEILKVVIQVIRLCQIVSWLLIVRHLSLGRCSHHTLAA